MTILEKFEEHLKSQGKSKSVYTQYPKYIVKASDIVKDGKRYLDAIMYGGISDQLDGCDGLLLGLEALLSDPALPTSNKSSCKCYMTGVRELDKFIRASAHPTALPAAKPTVKSAAKPSGKTASSKKPKVTPGRRRCSPCCKIPLGPDAAKVGNVSYRNDIPVYMRVPELCSCLDWNYKRILSLAGSLISFPIGSFLREIPVILSTECPLKDWEKGDDYLVREVKEHIMNSEGRTTPDKIRAILDDPYFHDRVLGRFFYKNTDPYIEIYYLNFDCSNIHRFFSAIASILAHEYMHYLQYSLCTHFGVTNPFSGAEATVVSEALADFFSLLYSVSEGKRQDIETAEDRYNLWCKRRGTGWPYAEALCFFTVSGNTLRFSDKLNDYFSHGSVQKLNEVFCDSPIPGIAYDTLKFR